MEVKLYYLLLFWVMLKLDLLLYRIFGRFPLIWRTVFNRRISV